MTDAERIAKMSTPKTDKVNRALAMGFYPPAKTWLAMRDELLSQNAQLEWIVAELLGEHDGGPPSYCTRAALLAKWEREAS